MPYKPMKFDRGLSLMDNVSWPSQEEASSLSLLHCMNYEMHRSGGLELMRDGMTWDGQDRFDFRNKRILICQGTLDDNLQGLGPNAGDRQGGYLCTWGGAQPGGGVYWNVTNGASDVTTDSYHVIYDAVGYPPFDFPSENYKIEVYNSGTGPHTSPFLFVQKFWAFDSIDDLLPMLAEIDSGAVFTSDGEFSSSRSRAVGSFPPVEAVMTFFLRLMQCQLYDYTPEVNCMPQPTSITNQDFLTGLFQHDEMLYAVAPPSYSTSAGQVIYKADPSVGWTAIDMGQEMSFDEGVFPIKFEDYIAYEASSRASYLYGGTSSSSELDYFPGQVCYWRDSTDSNREYWGTVVHAYVGRGVFAEGEFTDCEVATTTNIDLLSTTDYDAGDVIDGYTLIAGDRILVRKQDNADENGIWVVQASGAPVRATDLDETIEAITGYTVYVINGDEVGGTQWFLNNVDDLSVGVTGLVWTQGELAEGALTLYDTYDRTSGGSLTSGTSLPLSSTGTFGKWTEGNSVNFIDGNSEPAVGAQLTDGSATATVLKVIVDRGDWATNDASGTIIVGELASDWAEGAQLDIVSGATNALTTNNTIKDADRDALFDNTSASVGVTLPSWDEMEAAKSRYQSIEHNFFATDADGDPLSAPNDATFITNGAGAALKYDGTYLVRIRTGAAEDTPRHVSIHSNRLALGYADGSVSLSVEGEPANFNGVDGALAFGFSSDITNLVRVNGDTTAVFTDRTIELLQGTNDANIIARSVSENSGALEYTAVNIGDVIYVDRHGVNTLSAADTYGDFKTARISDDVDPLLLPRIRAKKVNQLTDQTLAVRVPGAVDFAIARNSESKYTIFFEDGNSLTGTLTPTGMQWTWQLHIDPNISNARGTLITAYSVGTDQYNSDAIYYFYPEMPNRKTNDTSYLLPTDSTTSTEREGPRRMYFVPALFTKTAAFITNPQMVDSSGREFGWNSMSLHGKYSGYLEPRTFVKGVDLRDVVTIREATQTTDLIDTELMVFRDLYWQELMPTGSQLSDATQIKIIPYTSTTTRTQVGQINNRWQEGNKRFQVAVTGAGRGSQISVGLIVGGSPNPAESADTLVGVGYHRIYFAVLDIKRRRDAKN